LKSLIAALLLIVSISSLNGQENISDSIINLGNTLESDSAKIDLLIQNAQIYLYQPGDNATDLLEYLTDFYEDSELKYGWDKLQYFKGGLSMKESRYTDAVRFYDNYIKFGIQENNKKKTANGFLAKANAYKELELLDSSFVSTHQAHKLYLEIADTVNLVKVLKSLGSINMRIDQPESGKDYYNQAISLADEYLPEGDQIFERNTRQDRVETDRGILFNDFGNLYHNENMVDSAHYYYGKFHEFALKKKNKRLQIYSYYNMCLTHGLMGEYQKAKEYALISFQLAEQLGITHMENDAKIAFGKWSSKLGSVNRGLEILHSISDEDLTLAQKQEYQEALFQSYQVENNYKKVFEHFEKYKIYSDSLVNVGMAATVSELELKFQKSENEKEIFQLSTENDLMGLRLKRASLQRIFLVLGLLALASIVYLLFRANRNAKKHRMILEEKNNQIQSALSDKETLLREIHHRVKNNLQVISSLLSLQSRQIDDPTAQQAIQEGRNRVKSMALIHQNLYQDEDLVGVDISVYIAKLSRSLVNSYKVSENIDIKTDIEKIKMDVDQIIPLGLILNELITNSLKYAFDEGVQGQIEVNLKSDDEYVRLEVKDNGKGLPEDFSIEALDSMGYKLIKSFTQKLKANLDISNQKVGTKVTLLLPNKNAA